MCPCCHFFIEEGNIQQKMVRMNFCQSRFTPVQIDSLHNTNRILRDEVRLLRTQVPLCTRDFLTRFAGVQS